MANTWGSDVPISMPVPSKDKVLVGMYGFGHTQYGIVHDISPSDYNHMRTPPGTPLTRPGTEVRDDLELDHLLAEGDFL